MKYVDLNACFQRSPFLQLAFSLELLPEPQHESARISALVVAFQSELARQGAGTGPQMVWITFGTTEEINEKEENATAKLRLPGFRRRMSDRSLAELVLSAVVPVMSRWFPRRLLEEVARSFIEKGQKYEWRSPELVAGLRRASVTAEFGMKEVKSVLRVQQEGLEFLFPLFSCPPATQDWYPRLGRLSADRNRIWVEMTRGAMFNEGSQVFVTGSGERGVRRFVVDVSSSVPTVTEDWSVGLRAGAGIATWENRGWSRQDLALKKQEGQAGETESRRRGRGSMRGREELSSEGKRSR